MTENIIGINKYLYFDKKRGKFCLTSEAQDIIYRQKWVICNYSGADEWCNHFVCELIDLYSGLSKYNYGVGTIVHEKEISNIWEQNKMSVCDWVKKTKDKAWGKRAFDMFVKIIDDLVIIE